MKNYTVIPNRISSLFSPNDLYTLIGLYFTANSNYSTDSTYLQIADITKQSFSYIKDNFMPRLEKSGSLLKKDLKEKDIFCHTHKLILE